VPDEGQFTDERRNLLQSKRKNVTEVLRHREKKWGESMEVLVNSTAKPREGTASQKQRERGIDGYLGGGKYSINRGTGPPGGCPTAGETRR